jgi:periplasmic copper chaperone A
MSRLPFVALAFAAFLLVPRLALAGQGPTGSITVDKAWSRATAPGVDIGVGYLTIKNDSDTPDRLVSVSAAVAEKVEMHQTQMVDGTMQMRPVHDGIPIPAKGTVMLEPAGYHLMLMGLKAPLQKGSTFGASLAFEHAGTVDVTFHVEGLGASTPGD